MKRKQARSALIFGLIAVLLSIVLELVGIASMTGGNVVVIILLVGGTFAVIFATIWYVLHPMRKT